MRVLPVSNYERELRGSNLYSIRLWSAADSSSGTSDPSHLVAAVGYDPLLDKQSIPRTSSSSELYDNAIRSRIQVVGGNDG